MTTELAVRAEGPAACAGVEVEYVDPGRGRERRALAACWSARFERVSPVRGFASFRGQRNWPGWWWFSRTGEHVGYESWVERDVLMALDADPGVEAVASQPMWLHWVSEAGKARRHAPDFFVRRADGTGVLVDVRPDHLVGAADSAVFAVTAAIAGQAGWTYDRVGELPAVRAANLRWLAGYRHPRYARAAVMATLEEVFAEPGPAGQTTAPAKPSSRSPHTPVSSGSPRAASKSTAPAIAPRPDAPASENMIKSRDAFCPEGPVTKSGRTGAGPSLSRPCRITRFFQLQYRRDGQLTEGGMGNVPTAQVEERIRSAFPEGAIERVQVLAHGDDPEVGPGQTAVRVILSRAGRPEGPEADQEILSTTRLGGPAPFIRLVGELPFLEWIEFRPHVPGRHGGCHPDVGPSMRFSPRLLNMPAQVKSRSSSRP
jgi:hypothetical protein